MPESISLYLLIAFGVLVVIAISSSLFVVLTIATVYWEQDADEDDRK